MSKINKVLKYYEFNETSQLFDYWVESFYNGQFKQCKQILLQMSVPYQVALLGYVSKDAGTRARAYIYCIELIASR